MPEGHGAVGVARRWRNRPLTGPWSCARATNDSQTDGVSLDGGETVNRVAVGAMSFGLIVGTTQPVAATVSFTPSLSLSERYTTNLFLTSGGYGDLATYVSPGAVVGYHDRRLDAAVSYLGSWEYYLRTPEQNRNSQSILADGQVRSLSRLLSGLTLHFSLGVMRTAGLPAYSFDDLAVDTGEGVGVSRLDTIRTRGRIAVRYTTSRRSSVVLAYATIMSRYDRFDAESIAEDLDIPGTDVIQAQDSVERDVDLTVEYVWTPRTTWSFVAERTFIQVDPNVPTEPFGDTSVTTRVTPGAEYRVNAAVNLTAHAGVMIFNVEDAVGAEQTITESAGDFNVTWEEGGTRAGLDYVREAGTGGGLAGATTISDRARLRVARTLKVSSAIFSHVGYSRTIPATAEGEEDFQIVSYEFRVGYEALIRKWLSASLAYQYFRQRSEGIDADLSEQLVQLTLTATGSTWRGLR